MTPFPKPGLRKRSFDPVVTIQTRLLILGSLPGEKSLAQQQYYANKQNRFWMLMSEVLELNLPELDYHERLQALLTRGVGLWDVVAEANREGSLDSQIREHTNNDLPGLLKQLPKLTTIAFNGGTAAKLGFKVLADYHNRYKMLQLPSSSPAYTLAYAEKLTQWKHMLPF